MIDSTQLRDKVVVPVLHRLDLWSKSAENLIMGTIAQESACGTYIAQIKGPALGICQMEPTTHDDIWKNYLAYKRTLARKVKNEASLRNISTYDVEAKELEANLAYSVAMCRVHYLRVIDPLPEDPNDIKELGKYYKKYYNTSKGKATVQQFIDNYSKYIK